MALISRKEAEKVLLEELRKEGRPIKTGELIRRVIQRFPVITPSALKRRTPTGTKFWPGSFRFVLDLLKKKGEAVSPAKGYWEITKLGIQRLTEPIQSPHRQELKLSFLEKELLDWAEEVIKSMKAGEVPGIIRTRKYGFTVELGEHIKETQIVLGRM